MNERTLRMNLDVTGIGKAGNLLSAICKDLGVRDSYREFQAEFNEPKHDGEEASPCFGVYINHPPPKKGPSEKHIALSRAVQSSSGRIVWCGYELDAHRPGRSCCSVWLYCRDQKRATWLRGRMTTVKGKRPPVFDSDRWHVVVNKPLESTQTDFDWFNSVLSAVIAVGKSA